MDGIGRVTSGTKTEQLSRITQDDSMDGIGRVASGTKTEQLSRTQLPKDAAWHKKTRINAGFPEDTNKNVKST